MPSFLTPAKLIGAGLILLLLVGLWLRGENYRGQRNAERAAHAETKVRYVAAQKEAEAKARAARASEEARSAALAKEADHDRTKTHLAAGTATDRFISTGPRCVVRPEEPSSPRRGTVAAAPDRPAGVPRGVPSPAVVAVAEPDVRAVGDLASYALSCRAWALDVTQP